MRGYRLPALAAATAALVIATLGLAGGALADVHCHAEGISVSNSDSDGNTCTAVADVTSVADAVATGVGSAATAVASAGSSASAEANDASTAIAVADDDSTARARARDCSAAIAVAGGSSGANADAGTCGAAVAVAEDEADARACARESGLAFAVATDPGSRATAEAVDDVAVAVATDGETVSSKPGGPCPAPEPEEPARPVFPASDLAVSVDGGNATVGAPFTFRITGQNLGEAEIANVRLIVTFPESSQSFLFAYGAATYGGCYWGAEPVTRVVCALSELKPGQSSSVSIVLIPAVAGKLTSSVLIGGEVSDTNEANDAASATATIAAA